MKHQHKLLRQENRDRAIRALRYYWEQIENGSHRNQLTLHCFVEFMYHLRKATDELWDYTYDADFNKAMDEMGSNAYKLLIKIYK